MGEAHSQLIEERPCEEESKILQINNVPLSLIFNQTNVKKQFLDITKAVISHELRNPLNSLVGQIISMDGFFDNFFEIISLIGEQKSLSRL